MGLKRILLKISGEALGGSAGVGFDFDQVRQVATECLAAVQRGVETAVVVGGGNFIRGEQIAPSGIDRVSGDQMGMLATVLNGMALRAVIEGLGGKADVFSSFPVGTGVELFDRRTCLERLAQGRLVIFVAGTGNPFFTTDTAAALRASEIGAELFLKATKVDGVYDKDPVKHADAKRYDRLSYMEVVEQQLGVMDITAVTLCMENRIPIRVFNLMVAGNVNSVLDGGTPGTLIT